MLVATFVEV